MQCMFDASAMLVFSRELVYIRVLIGSHTSTDAQSCLPVVAWQSGPLDMDN